MIPEMPASAGARVNSAEDILQEAICIARGQTGKHTEHGKPERAFAKLGELWTLYLGMRHDPQAPITGSEAAVMLALLKVCRMTMGTPTRDHFVDGANYIALAGEEALRAPETKVVHGKSKVWDKAVSYDAALADVKEQRRAQEARGPLSDAEIFRGYAAYVRANPVIQEDDRTMIANKFEDAAAIAALLDPRDGHRGNVS